MSRIPAGVPGLIPLIVLVIVGWLGVGSRRARDGLARRVAGRPVLALVPALVLLRGSSCTRRSAAGSGSTRS